jgi:cephalosporin hydroxylase
LTAASTLVLTAGLERSASNATEERRILYRQGVTEAPVRNKAMDEVKRTWVNYYEKNHLHQHQTFLGARFGQNPMDAFIIQEIIWNVKPDLIIETGTNSGGSALFYAFLLEAMNPDGKVVTMDMDPIDRWHAQWGQEIDPRTWSYWQKRVTALTDAQQGSTAPAVLEQVRLMASQAGTVLVILDSCHEYECVKGEIEAFHPLVTPGSYMIVEDLDKFPTGAGRAAREFAQANPGEWAVDKTREYLYITEHTNGYLRRL